MGKSATVGVRDAMRVIRLYKELAELPTTLSLRRQHAADALCTLFRSQVGVINDGTEFVIRGNPRLKIPTAGGWVGPEEQKIFERYIRSDDHCVDPMLRPMAALRPKLVTRRRADVVEDRDWYDTGHVSDDRRTAGVDDAIYSILRKDRSGNIQILAVHRPWGDRTRFTRREQALLNLLHRATADLLEPATESLADQRTASLSPRLKQTLELLLTALSEKETAARMGVSNHTIHGYVKQIYVHLGVESRAELMALCLTDRHRSQNSNQLKRA